jgi:hypothetical protein
VHEKPEDLHPKTVVEYFWVKINDDDGGIDQNEAGDIDWSMVRFYRDCKTMKIPILNYF